MSNDEAFEKFCACFDGFKPAVDKFEEEIRKSDLSEDEKTFWKNLWQDFADKRFALLEELIVFIYSKEISRESWKKYCEENNLL